MMGSEPPLPDTPRISGDDQESGLWLLHGQTPAQGEMTQPAPPAKGIGYLLGFAARGAKRLKSRDLLWLVLVLIGLAAWAAVVFLPDRESVPKNTPIAASPPVPSAIVANPAGLEPPAAATTAQLDQAPTPPAAAATAQLDQASTPPAAATTAQLDQPPTPPSLIDQPMEGSIGPRTLKPRASHRPRHVRKVHGAFVAGQYDLSSEPRGERRLIQRWALEPCRYSCDSWAVPMTWHGGGY